MRQEKRASFVYQYSCLPMLLLCCSAEVHLASCDLLHSRLAGMSGASYSMIVITIVTTRQTDVERGKLQAQSPGSLCCRRAKSDKAASWRKSSSAAKPRLTSAPCLVSQSSSLLCLTRSCCSSLELCMAILTRSRHRLSSTAVILDRASLPGAADWLAECCC